MADVAAANQEYFNKAASEYDQKFEKILAQLEQELKANSDFIGVKRGGRLLDYACGPGLLSRAFGEQLSQCVGIDVSESMVEAYNAKAKTEGKWPGAKVAHLGNLALPDDPSPGAFSGPEFFDFDMAGVGSGFHHFDDCDLAAQRLSARLRAGGVLFVLDFLPHGHDAGVAGVKHQGFSEGTMRAMFEGAGAGGDFKFKELDKGIAFESSGHTMTRHVFLARGTKT